MALSVPLWILLQVAPLTSPRRYENIFSKVEMLK